MARPLRSCLLYAVPILGLAIACAPAHKVRFVGSSLNPAVSADDLIQRVDIPHDHDPIGTVQASCLRSEGDDSCSEWVLLRSMRREAAKVGGTAFIAPSCRYHPVEASGQRMDCEATVARDRALGSIPQVKTKAPWERQWEVRVQEHGIRVTVRPREGYVPKPRPLGDVEVVWSTEVSRRSVGIVRADCMHACERKHAEQGVVHGGAWLGAGEITSLRCYESTVNHWTCTGEALEDLVP